MNTDEEEGQDLKSAFQHGLVKKVLQETMDLMWTVQASSHKKTDWCGVKRE